MRASPCGGILLGTLLFFIEIVPDLTENLENEPFVEGGAIHSRREVA